MGPNSAHPNLVEILGDLLNKDIYLISPTNSEGVHDAIYNDEINEFFVPSLIGTGLGLSKSIDINSEKSQEFKYIKKYIFDKSKLNSSLDIKKSKNNNPSENKLKSLKKLDNYSANNKLILEDKANKNSINEEKKTSLNKNSTNEKIKSKNIIKDDNEFKFDKKFLE